MNYISSVFIFAIADYSSEGDKTGVTKKIIGQVRGFERNGIKTTFIKRYNHGYILSDSQNEYIQLSNNTSLYNYKIKNEIALSLLQYYKKAGAPDLIYCRGTRIFHGCKALLSYLYTNGKHILIEIPTVTRLFAHKEPKEFFIEFIDRTALLFLRKYIDAYVVMSHDQKLFGRKTIHINNGIDSERVSMIEPSPHHGIHMLGVAMMQTWHGYERIIEGLNSYYATEPSPEDVFLDLVGEGPETNMYRDLTAKYKLQDKVTFHGIMHGEELDKIYNQCDLGIGSFGMYKMDIRNGSILKLKEYCAKGIPFIYACPEDTLNPSLEFCKLFSNDPAPIDIKEVLSFYHGLENRMDQIRTEMRQFAKNELSWTKEMRHVIEEIERK